MERMPVSDPFRRPGVGNISGRRAITSLPGKVSKNVLRERPEAGLRRAEHASGKPFPYNLFSYSQGAKRSFLLYLDRLKLIFYHQASVF